MNENEAMLAFLGVMAVFVLAIVPIVGGFMQVRRERLLTHTERMKALELGAGWPDDVATARIRAAFGQPTAEGPDDGQSLARKLFSTAFWIAFWGFGSAAGIGQTSGSAGVAYAVAASVGAIGVTAVICGTLLAFSEGSRPLADRSKPPAFDDEALVGLAERGNGRAY